MNRLWLAAVLSLGVISCADDPDQTIDEQNEESEQEALGNLSLNLTGSDSQGRQYRLRNAEFYVTSNYYYPPDPWFPSYDGGMGFSTRLFTETDPDAATLSVRLVPGQYFVALEGDWYVERLTPTGFERVEQVVLLNEAFQYAYIYHDGVTPIAFRFGVDGELIDFRHGDLVIDAEFELPGEGPYGPGYPIRDGGVGPVLDAGAGRPIAL